MAKYKFWFGTSKCIFNKIKNHYCMPTLCEFLFRLCATYYSATTQLPYNWWVMRLKSNNVETIWAEMYDRQHIAHIGLYCCLLFMLCLLWTTPWTGVLTSSNTVFTHRQWRTAHAHSVDSETVTYSACAVHSRESCALRTVEPVKRVQL